MKHKNLPFEKGFHVAIGNEYSQAAEMVIEPGGSEGGPDNTHEADQWLYVVEGEGTAIVDGKEFSLSAGSLVLIEKGDKHEIRNIGSELLKTLNFYVPPVY